MRKLKVTEMGRLTLGEFRETEKQPIAVVLDHVRSLHNVGSVFRTSDAFCIEEVLLCGITAQPPHPEIHKTALGAEESVSWRYFKETDPFNEIWAADPDAIPELRSVFFSRLLDSNFRKYVQGWKTNPKAAPDAQNATV